MRSLIICLLAIGSALAMPADVAENKGGCPGGYAEGAEIERGRLVYVCQGGQVVPKACIAEDLSRIAVGSNYDNGKYRRACKVEGDSLTFEATGCLSNGQEHKVGDTWGDADGVFTCKQNPDGSLTATSTGCSDGGKNVNEKEKVAKDTTLFECQAAQNGKFKLVPVGCVQDGKQYKAGDSFESGDTWYNCTRIGREKVVAKAAGCVQGGKRLNDGDRFNDGEVFRECRIDAGKMSLVIVACAQKDASGTVVERRLGCTWTEGDAPFQYEWTCADEGGKAVKKQVRCNYNVGGGTYQIETGCYRAVDKGVAGCLVQPGGMKLQLFEGDKADGAAQGAGLKAC